MTIGQPDGQEIGVGAKMILATANRLLICSLTEEVIMKHSSGDCRCHKSVLMMHASGNTDPETCYMWWFVPLLKVICAIAVDIVLILLFVQFDGCDCSGDGLIKRRRTYRLTSV